MLANTTMFDTTSLLGATSLFGWKAPDGAGSFGGAGILIALFFIVGIFFVSRGGDGSPSGPNRAGRGRMVQCGRCGRRFQPEQVELMRNGDVRHFVDDHCPNCGWDLDWGSPNKPGGASGKW